MLIIKKYLTLCPFCSISLSGLSPPSSCSQSRLQECLKERGELLQALEAADRIREREKDRSGRVKESWERVRRQLERDLADLKEELGQSQEEVEEMKRKQEVWGRS